MSEQIPASCSALLQAMVAFDTVNSNISGKPDAELALAQYLESLARALGFDTERLPVSGLGFNLLVTRRVAEGAPWLLFESHLDTVSVEGMTIDPFAGRIEEGRLYGRGACDTKGSGAAMLWALQRGVEQGCLANNVAILYTVDEELEKTGVRSFVERHVTALGWKAAGAIIGEPTGLGLVAAHNGVVRWKITTRGRAAHSSDPNNGRSAISMMLRVVDALESRYIAELRVSHPLTGKAQCSVNIIRGGTQVNIIPEHCEISVDRRVVPGEDPEEVLPAVEQILDQVRRDEPALEVRQETPDMVDLPLDPRGGEEFAGFVQQVLGSMLLPAGLQGAGYGTDASSLGPARIPAVVLGPGSIAQGHTADEWIDLEELDRGVEVYLALMSTALQAGG